MHYKPENQYALSHEQCFSTYRFKKKGKKWNAKEKNAQ